jgi:hypothetical protein
MIRVTAELSSSGDVTVIRAVCEKYRGEVETFFCGRNMLKLSHFEHVK